MVNSVISFFLATVITVPLIGWYLVYIVTVKVTKRKAFSIRLAADLSAILFILSVYFILQEIWQRSFLSVILILFFSVAIIFTIIHWRNSESIYTWKLFKGIWRVNFLIFFIAYFLLSIYGLLARIISS